jgi:hypothetical protein
MLFDEHPSVVAIVGMQPAFVTMSSAIIDDAMPLGPVWPRPFMARSFVAMLMP